MTKVSPNKFLEGEKVVSSIVKTLPNKPGVYRMMDNSGNVLYVGKAKNLRNRVSSYSRVSGHSLRIGRMISATRDMNFFITETELEALLLEQNLIKKYNPRYNVLLKDDKSFPQIAITRNKQFPQITKYRGKKVDGVKYFGPYASATAVNNAINYIQKIFQLRNCRDSNFYGRSRACLLHFINKCSAPCVGKISEQEYLRTVQEAENFLLGKHNEIKDSLQSDMLKASKSLDFERAAFYRDRIELIAKIQSSQNINNLNVKDADVIGLFKLGNEVCIQIFFIRSFENRGNHAFFPKNGGGADEIEIIESFLAQFYSTKIPAREIILSSPLRSNEVLLNFLTERRKSKVIIRSPSKGRLKDLIKTAEKNAKEALERKIALKASQQSLFDEVEKWLKIETKIEKIEVYDNSHIQGSFPIGCLVAINTEGYSKSDYRKYNINDSSINPKDDLAIMRHVFERRFGKKKNENHDDFSKNLPDLIVIDGGRNQMNVASTVLKKYKIKIPILAIAKGEKRNEGREDFYFQDRIFNFPTSSSLLFFFQRIRDEVHRFAIGAHRQKRSTGINKSELDEVYGIGPKKKKELLQHFGSAKEVGKASLKDLLGVKGISKNSAEIIFNHFNS